MRGGLFLGFGSYFDVAIRLLFFAFGIDVFELSGDFFVVFFESVFFPFDLLLPVYSWIGFSYLAYGFLVNLIFCSELSNYFVLLLYS
jgi:hypothetical protein